MNEIIKKERKLLKEKSHLEFRVSVLSPKRNFFGRETIVPVENLLKIEEYQKRISAIKENLKTLENVKNENNK